MQQRTRLHSPILLMVVATAVTGCSVKRMAVDVLGDALSDNGYVFTSDEDPDLVRDAAPFGLKTYESLLAVSPDHKGLLLAAASGFAGYAYILEQEAELASDDQPAFAARQRSRASKLFLRGHEYALRGLEVRHPGILALLKEHPAAALAETNKGDLAFLYWAGAGLAGALGANKSDPQLTGDLPLAAALVGRVLQLDDTYEDGAAQEFFVTYEGARPGGSEALARHYYQRALQLSGGNRASLYLALAENVSVRDQNLKEFRALVHAALSVDLGRVPRWRVANTLAIRRARYLQDHLSDLFIAADITE